MTPFAGIGSARPSTSGLSCVGVGVQAQHRVARGTWFVEKGPDWVPIRETLADELETAYRSEASHVRRFTIMTCSLPYLVCS